jgi:hypothetical protein
MLPPRNQGGSYQPSKVYISSQSEHDTFTTMVEYNIPSHVPLVRISQRHCMHGTATHDASIAFTDTMRTAIQFIHLE